MQNQRDGTRKEFNCCIVIKYCNFYIVGQGKVDVLISSFATSEKYYSKWESCEVYSNIKEEPQLYIRYIACDTYLWLNEKKKKKKTAMKNFIFNIFLRFYRKIQR